MANRQEEASHGWWNQPDEVGTQMNLLVMRACDLKEEISRVNREIEELSHHLKALMKKRVLIERKKQIDRVVAKSITTTSCRHRSKKCR
jgi:hypothetical protein